MIMIVDVNGSFRAIEVSLLHPEVVSWMLFRGMTRKQNFVITKSSLLQDTPEKALAQIGEMAGFSGFSSNREAVEFCTKMANE